MAFEGHCFGGNFKLARAGCIIVSTLALTLSLLYGLATFSPGSLADPSWLGELQGGQALVLNLRAWPTGLRALSKAEALETKPERASSQIVDSLEPEFDIGSDQGLVEEQLAFSTEEVQTRLDVQDGSQREPLSKSEETRTSSQLNLEERTKNPANVELAIRAGQSSAAIPVFCFVDSTEIYYDVSTTLMLSKAYNRELEYCILTTQDDNAWREAGQLDSLESLGVRFVQVGKGWQSSHPEVEAFRRIYHHQSLNGLLYERLCFERWFYVKFAALYEGVEHVIISDADIALFGNVQESPFVKDPAAFVSINEQSTHFASWRTEALVAFCDFMLSFYQRPQDEIESDIETWGIELQDENGTMVRHFSDMYLLTAFLSLTDVTKTMLGYDDKGLWGLNHPNMLRPQDKPDFQTCESMEHFDACVSWRETDNAMMAPFFEDFPLFAIHFQGPDCKQLILPNMLSRAKRKG